MIKHKPSRRRDFCGVASLQWLSDPTPRSGEKADLIKSELNSIVILIEDTRLLSLHSLSPDCPGFKLTGFVVDGLLEYIACIW